MFEQKNGLAHCVDVGGLGDLVKAGGTPPRLVFVAACHSEAAARCFLEAGVPCVVAVRLKEQLHDVAAIEFTKQFYVAIASGHTVRQAFEIGEQAVRVAPELNKQASIHTDPRARSSPLTCRMLRVLDRPQAARADVTRST